MPSTNPLLAFKVPPQLLARIDVYWHRRRIANRATAIKELLDAALDAAGIPDAADPPPER